MNGLAFQVSCPQCGGTSWRLVNQCARGNPATTELVGVVHCCGCQREYSVSVWLRPHQAQTREQRSAAERQRYRRQRQASLT